MNTGSAFSQYIEGGTGRGYIGTSNSLISAGLTGFCVRGESAINFSIAGSNAATIDASGNLLVGASIGANTAGFTNKLYIESSVPAITLKNTGGGHYSLGLTDANTFGLWDNTSSTYRWLVDASGNLLVGTTSTINGGLGVFSKPNGNQIVVNSENSNGGSIDWTSGGSLAARIGGLTTNPAVAFQVQTNGSGGVQLSSGATAWAAMSDERLKDIIEPITNAVDKVSTLRAVIGKYKVDEADKRRAFLIAQDVLAVLPEATSMSTISLDDPEEYLAVQYTEVIPLLVAAIKELTARIETLEGA